MSNEELSEDERYRLVHERINDGDLISAVQYNLAGELDLLDVAMILATIEGENDGPPWHWLLAMKDGRYAYVTGGCDYTGWDCQSGADVHYAPTQTEALALVPQDERRVFEEMFAAKEHTRRNTGGI